MSSRGLLAGYRVAGAGQAPIVDLSAKADEVAKYKLLSDQVTYQRQKAFDDERKQFKKDMADAYDETIYEDNFDDTGITNLDAAGTKLQTQLKQAYIENQYAYDQNLIDEAEYKSRSNKLKGEVNQVVNLIGDINKATSDYQALEDSGKGSAINRNKIKLLEDLGNNIRFTRGPNGLAINTLRADVDEEGNETGLPPSEVSLGVRNFKDLLNMENGFDSTTAVENIVARGGFEEKLADIQKGRGFDQKIKSFLDGKDVKDVVNAEIKQMTKSQKLDYLLKNQKITEDEVDKLMFSKERLSKDLNDKVEDAFKLDVEAALKFKEEKSVFKDDFALAAYRQHLSGGSGKDPKYKIARVTPDMDNSNLGPRTQYLPEEAVPISNLTAQDRLFQTLANQQGGLPPELRQMMQGTEVEEDVLKGAKIQMLQHYENTGQYELSFTFQKPIDKGTGTSNRRGQGNKYMEKGDEEFQDISAKLAIKDIELLNQIFVAIGADPISATQEDYDAAIKRAKENNKQAQVDRFNTSIK